MAETAECLIAYCRENGRICPMPIPWNKLWEMLPDRRRVGGGWEPPPPLILAAWHAASGLDKRLRLAEHIEWAEKRGCLDAVSDYLRSLLREGLVPLERLAERGRRGDMADQLCFVQFIHPGGEHVPDALGHKGWNKGAHRRKFLVSEGRYVSESKLNTGQIAFWGEWEPQSEVIAEIADPHPQHPRFVYRPFYVRPKTYQACLANTDPFIFGDQFHYTGCQQHTAGRPNTLRYLDRGSVVLFGSCMGKQRFVLDTVFVVSHWIDHDAGTFRSALNVRISDTYADVTISPWYGQDFFGIAASMRANSFRLYFGASYDAPVDGMFSFFPCASFTPGYRGFPRPAIQMDDYITDNLNQGRKITRCSDTAEIRKLWDIVAGQVAGAGLQHGVHAPLPPCVEETTMATQGEAGCRRC